MTQLTVHARPARDSTNPYTILFAEALERQGLEVREVAMVRRDLPFAPDVLLLHWPDEFYRRPRDLKTRISDWLRLFHLALARRMSGLSIVWVAHNARPHDDAPAKPPLRWKWFLRLVDGVIALSADSMAEVLAAYPVLRGRPALVTRHGHYLDRAITPPRLPPDNADRPVRLAALGAIRAYKRTGDFARAVAAAQADVSLFIAGKPARHALADELAAIAAACPRIALRFGYLSEKDLEAATDAADLIVLPYADVLNSGVLFHALSRYRPVVAPRRGSIPQVRDEVGENWIHLFEGEFGVDTLEQAIAWLRATSRDAPPDLSGQDWDVIGAEIAGFLKSMIDERKGRVR